MAVSKPEHPIKANHTGSNGDASAEAVTVSWGLERMNTTSMTTQLLSTGSPGSQELREHDRETYRKGHQSRKWSFKTRQVSKTVQL